VSAGLRLEQLVSFRLLDDPKIGGIADFLVLNQSRDS